MNLKEVLHQLSTLKTPKTFQVLTASGTPEGEQYLRMGKFAKGIDKINVRFMK